MEIEIREGEPRRAFVRTEPVRPAGNSFGKRAGDQEITREVEVNVLVKEFHPRQRVRAVPRDALLQIEQFLRADILPDDLIDACVRAEAQRIQVACLLERSACPQEVSRRQLRAPNAKPRLGVGVIKLQRLLEIGERDEPV